MGNKNMLWTVLAICFAALGCNGSTTTIYIGPDASIGTLCQLCQPYVNMSGQTVLSCQNVACPNLDAGVVQPDGSVTTPDDGGVVVVTDAGMDGSVSESMDASIDAPMSGDAGTTEEGTVCRACRAGEVWVCPPGERCYEEFRLMCEVVSCEGFVVEEGDAAAPICWAYDCTSSTHCEWGPFSCDDVCNGWTSEYGGSQYTCDSASYFDGGLQEGGSCPYAYLGNGAWSNVCDNLCEGSYCDAYNSGYGTHTCNVPSYCPPDAGVDAASDSAVDAGFCNTYLGSGSYYNYACDYIQSNGMYCFGSFCDGAASGYGWHYCSIASSCPYDGGVDSGYADASADAASDASSTCNVYYGPGMGYYSYPCSSLNLDAGTMCYGYFCENNTSLSYGYYACYVPTSCPSDAGTSG